MGIRALNTDKELKKDKFGTANHADTIQPKSMDGLQNHADTQKLIRVKTAAEQSNHHKKISQLQTKGEARSQKIQNGGVAQLMFRAAGSRILEAGARAAPRIAKVGVGLAAADQLTGASAGYLMNDKNKFAMHSFSLAESAIGKMKIPVTVKSAAEGFFGTLAEEAETFPFEETNAFDDTQNQIIAEEVRNFSALLDENDIPNPIAPFISMDNIQSRFFALAEVAKNRELELILGRMRFDEEFERGRVAEAGKFAAEHPEVDAFNKSQGR
jgi:hypothetical protein